MNAHTSRLLIVALGLSVATPALAQEETDQLKKLDQRVSALEKEAGKTGKKPFGWTIPGTKTQLTIGGYAKLDVIAMSNSLDNTNDYETIAGLIPTADDKGADWQLNMHARQSRFWIKTMTPTEMGAMTTHVEIDFFGGQGSRKISNPHIPRLRHAYGTLGPVLAGQTWSTFMQLIGLAPNLDFLGTVGTVFVRQPQLRYTHQLGDGLSFAVSLENPHATFFNPTTVAAAATAGAFAPEDDNLPDLAVRVDHKGAYGQVSFAAIARQMRYDFGTDASASTFGFGANVAWKLKLGVGTVSGMVVGGTGLGRYVTTGFAPAAWVKSDAAGAPTDIGGTIPTVAGTLSYEHYVIPKRISAALSGSATTVMLPDEIKNHGLNKNVMQGTLTLKYTPVANTMFGVEYNLMRREVDTNGAPDPDLQHRVQASAMFKF